MCVIAAMSATKSGGRYIIAAVHSVKVEYHVSGFIYFYFLWCNLLLCFPPSFLPAFLPSFQARDGVSSIYAIQTMYLLT